MSVTLHIVDLWRIICMLYKIRYNPMHLFMKRHLDRRVSAGYTRCFGRSSEHLCASSQLNLAVPQVWEGKGEGLRGAERSLYNDLGDNVNDLGDNVNDLGDNVCNGVVLAGFKSSANAFLLS